MNRISLLLLFFILISSPILASSSFADSIYSENLETQNNLNDFSENSAYIEEQYELKILAADGITISDTTNPTDQKQNQQKSATTKAKNLKIFKIYKRDL